MYFSITYGPDASGHVSMNFGPMNKSGGERRLNVAITRARHELRVFSSVKAEQFDLSRTQGLGVHDLKHFLEFAERGTRALAEATKGSLGGFESPFEEAVAGALASKDWRVDTQIGASSFRVDLAVVHPDAPGLYLCGVECDGATYHRSATARDRDLLREQVLRGLGWEVLRVWSTDWWIDRNGTLAKLHEGLEALLAKSREARAREKELENAKRAAEEAILRAREEAAAQAGEAVEPVPAQPRGPAQRPASVDEAMREEVYARPHLQASSSSAGFTEADLRNAGVIAKPEAFFDVAYDAQLRAMIDFVVDIEGPTLDSVLARRIARAHGWQRTGARIQDRVSILAASHLRTTHESVGSFFWPRSQLPDAPLAFRGGSEDGRSVDEICMPELVALAKNVVAGGASGDSAVVAMARQLGQQRVRAAGRGRFEEALKLASEQ